METSCERLRREIENYSTPQARNSSIASLVCAIGTSHVTDDTVIMQEKKLSENLSEEGIANKHVTVRPARAQNTNGRNEAELADDLYNYIVQIKVMSIQ